jgi:hypothetical protein
MAKIMYAMCKSSKMEEETMKGNTEAQLGIAPGTILIFAQ